MKIAFVGTGELINRLPETFARPALEIVVLGPKNCSLRRSRFINEFIELPAIDPIELWQDTVIANYKTILEQQADWVIFSDDETIGALSRSGIPLIDKLKLLPVHAEAGLELLGSKVGLANTMNRLNISVPKSIVVEAPEKLMAATASIKGDFLIKGDLYGGGSRVRKFTETDTAELGQIPVEWFPLVVQEFISGTEVSIEALFRGGQLVAWLYSEMLETMGEFGPSTVRRYCNPIVRDFEGTLNQIGANAKLNGLFNCALIWSPMSGTHSLFELDPRPNSWHQFGNRFGVDWVELMLGEQTRRIVSPSAHSDEVLHLYPRDLRYALTSGSWPRVKPWLTRAKGTWQNRNRTDTSINRLEAREVFYWFAPPLIATAAKIWQSLPLTLQRTLVKIGVKSAVIFIIGA